MGTESGVVRKKTRILFPPPPPPICGHFWPRVGVFLFFCFFMGVLLTDPSCGTKEALFSKYFWYSLFLRCFLAVFFFLPHA